MFNKTLNTDWISYNQLLAVPVMIVTKLMMTEDMFILKLIFKTYSDVLI